MKIIESSVELLKQGPGIEGLYKHMETVGRVSHKSEAKEGSTSKEFIERIKKLGHWAVFDLGTVYLKVPRDKMLAELLSEKWVSYNEDGYFYYITTTYRVILRYGLEKFMEDYWSEPEKNHKIRVTSRWICSRAIANEIVRHRDFSFIQESTRYINYSRSRFGSELVYIVPEWVEKFRPAEYEHLSKPDLWGVMKFKVPAISIREKIWKMAEDEYIWETSEKILVPGDARGCLPGDLKTELYMCGYFSDYYKSSESEEKVGFFTLREAPDAHPDLRVLAEKLDKLIKEDEDYRRS